MAAQQSIPPMSISMQSLQRPAYHVMQIVPRNVLACALSALALVGTPNAALGSIPLSAPPAQEQQRRALTQLGVSVRRPQRNIDTEEEEPVRKKVERVTALMAEAAQAAEDGDWPAALNCNSEIIARYPDLALAERARIARALLLYQVDRPQDALLQLEDEEVALRGSAEVHAALAVVFYGLGKPVQAEQQWAVASEFDKRYSDVAWVAAEKHWPPKLLQALEKFLTLS